MSTVLAYLDPGSGSMILQALLGGAAGLFVAIKETLFFWRKNEDEAPAADKAPTASVPEPAPEPKVKTGV